MSAPRLLAPTTISGGVPTAGAGTLNTIALWTPDGNTLGNSLLTQSGNIVTNASGAIRAAGTTQTSPAFTRHDTTTSGIYFPATNEIGFTISNQHAMFISSGRNVGFGTTSPGSRVSVRSNTTSAGATPIYTIQANRQNSDTAGFLIGMDGNLDAALAVNGDSRSIRFGKDVSATFTEWGRFDSAGNFGIGTASPTATATVYKANNGLGAWNALDLSVDGLSLNDAVYQRWYAASVSATVGRFGISFAAGVASFVWNSVYNSVPQTAELMRLTGGGNLGIGAASPGDRLQIGAPTGTAPFGIIIGENYGAASQRARLAFGDANRGIGLTSGDNVLIHTFNTNSILFGHGSTTSFTERARIDSAGRALWNKTGTPTGSGIAHVVGPRSGATAGGTEWVGSAGNGFALIQRSSGGADVYSFTGDVGAEAYTQIGLWDASSLNISLVSGYGLKLPATPGNADVQTLDCYQEGTWVPTLTGFGGTTPTATIARYTRVGRLVTVHVLLTATGGNQFSSTAATTLLTLPSGMTPAADAAGSTSNSVIGADGPCVAYTNGNLYVPTFALRTANTILTVTYSV